jgi:hypothetical protein
MGDEWGLAYAALHKRIVEHPQFRALVRGYGGNPNGKVPSRRCARVADVICKSLGIDPKIYRGNVFGAAADALRQHTLTPHP